MNLCTFSLLTTVASTAGSLPSFGNKSKWTSSERSSTVSDFSLGKNDELFGIPVICAVSLIEQLFAAFCSSFPFDLLWFLRTLPFCSERNPKMEWAATIVAECNKRLTNDIWFFWNDSITCSKILSGIEPLNVLAIFCGSAFQFKNT